MQTGINDGTTTAIIGGDLAEGCARRHGCGSERERGRASSSLAAAASVRAASSSGSSARRRREACDDEPVDLRCARSERIYTLGEVEVHALRGVSLDVQPGEFVAITGTVGLGQVAR